MLLPPESIRLVSGKANRSLAPQGRGFKPRPRLQLRQEKFLPIETLPTLTPVIFDDSSRPVPSGRLEELERVRSGLLRACVRSS